MQSFKSYQDFLIFLIKHTDCGLQENCEILEKFISVEKCFKEEPHLFNAFVSQCFSKLTVQEKEAFESFVSSYFILKSEGFFETSKLNSEDLNAEAVIVEKPIYAPYASSMEEFSEKELERSINYLHLS